MEPVDSGELVVLEDGLQTQPSGGLDPATIVEADGGLLSVDEAALPTEDMAGSGAADTTVETTEGAASEVAPPPPPAAADGDDTSMQTVYVSYSERREHVSSKQGGRKSGGHVYQIKFFLVDATGMEHLAALGEDQGDAHYIYSNQPGFPGLYGHNKQDVKRWLEEVMAASQLRAGYHLDRAADDEGESAALRDPASIRLPTFVAYRHERRELPDGRHAMRWSLVDVFGREHLAVAGEEKETRDGHYDYRTQGMFDVVAPLSCHNQSAVTKWLDARVVHKGLAPPIGGGKGAHGRGGSLGKAGRKAGGELARAAALRKWRGAGSAGGPPLDPVADAREALAGELRRWGREEDSARSAARSAALSYVRDAAPAEAEAAAERLEKTLPEALAEPDAVLGPPPPSGGMTSSNTVNDAIETTGLFTTEQFRARRSLIADLRILAHCYAPLALASREALQRLLDDASRELATRFLELATLASGILERWTRALGVHVAVLTQGRYVSDPNVELEAALADRGWVESAARAVTHRPAPLPADVIDPSEQLLPVAKRAKREGDTTMTIASARAQEENTPTEKTDAVEDEVVVASNAQEEG